MFPKTPEKLYEKIQYNEPYNVPNGKRLYITNFYTEGYSFFINDVLLNIDNLSQPISRLNFINSLK